MTKRPPLSVKPPATSPEAEQSLRRIIDIMASLRNPNGGCEWDIKQTHETISPYAIEEAYEVAEAVITGTSDDLREELGDLLLQVVFQARIAEEAGNFDFADIADRISEKMIKRHPHIFGRSEHRTADEQRQAWEDIKANERKLKNKDGVFDDIASTLPAMIRAVKLQNRASRVGFDWDNPFDVIKKIKEELNEVIEEMGNQDDFNKSRLESEIGDLLFTVINLARKNDVDPDQALSSTNRKFIKRFNFIQAKANENKILLEDVSLEEMENWWLESKLLD